MTLERQIMSALPDASVHVTLRLDFVASPEAPRTGRVGPGKIALLEAVGRSGSISAAARALGLSYRRAWLMIDEMNHLFRDPVVTAGAGGAKGGQATLTALGSKLVDTYRELEADAEQRAKTRLFALAKEVAR